MNKEKKYPFTIVKIRILLIAMILLKIFIIKSPAKAFFAHDISRYNFSQYDIPQPDALKHSSTYLVTSRYSANHHEAESKNIPEFSLLLTEVNFKNTEKDYLKFIVISTKTVNLKKINFQDDKIFKTIDKDFFVSDREVITLYFNSKEQDQPDQRLLFTDHKGLTATTEQLIIKSADHIYDFLCWANSTPSQTEIKNFNQMAKITVWESTDIASCFDSKLVDKNFSLIRKRSDISAYVDSNTQADWAVVNTHQKNLNDLPETLTSKTGKQSTHKHSNQPSAKRISDHLASPLNQNKKRTKNNKIKKVERHRKNSIKKYRDGDLSNQILITEIMPNPSGNDRKKEWIEIFNSGSKEINLGNWLLDDSEQGSKPYVFTDQTIIKPQENLVISSEKSKLALGNNEDEVRLLDFKKNIISQVNYSEALENKSYALITTEQHAKFAVSNVHLSPHSSDNSLNRNPAAEQKWQWTEDITPQAKNPLYEQIEGKVLSPPSFKNIHAFDLQIKNGETFNIIFDEKLIEGPLAKITFKPGNELKLTGIIINNIAVTNRENKNPNTLNNILKLRNYEVLSTSPNTSSPYSGLSIIISIVAIICAYFIFKKPKQWKELIS